MEHSRLYINGRWVEPNGRELIEDINPATEEVIAKIPAGDAQDIDLAVASAAATFDGWSTVSRENRASAIRAIADGLRRRQQELAELITREVGTPMAKSLAYQTRSAIAVAEVIADLLAESLQDEKIGHSLIWREPVGVVACITPWNFPLHQIVAKVVPAIAAGCTVVLKPSELAPLTAFALADLMHQVGVPPGVFNLVPGHGSIAGEALAAHPAVDMISFTGSTEAGRRIATLAAPSVKRVHQELGGKSACVILEDADLKRAVRTALNSCFLNSGQTCFALTRMLVPAERHDEAVEFAVRIARTFDLGDPLTSRAKLGPLISKAQRRRVQSLIGLGIEEGASLAIGGAAAPPGMERGFFVQPTVFSDVGPEMTIAREEIFGPVLSIMPYETEEHAIEINNSTAYGLSGAVWSGEPDRALRVARRLRCGQVDINGASFNPAAPFGGYRQSGNGRELGSYGLDAFFELKSVQL